MPRRYELKERARRQEDTRRRIVEATVSLHRELGPARTTVAEVARRAGVGRVTVYNHFPEEAELLAACSAHFVASSPPPDAGRWEAIADPAERLQAALAETYAYFRANEAMIANVTRDLALVPALGEVMEAAGAREAEARTAAVLLAGRGLRGGRRRRVLAAIGLALAFATWQRLVRDGGLEDAEAVSVMAAAVEVV